MENLPPWVLEFRDAPAIAGAGFGSRGCLSLLHHSAGPSQHRPVKLQPSTSGFSSNPSDLLGFGQGVPNGHGAWAPHFGAFSIILPALQIISKFSGLHNLLEG